MYVFIVTTILLQSLSICLSINLSREKNLYDDVKNIPESLNSIKLMNVCELSTTSQLRNKITSHLITG